MSAITTNADLSLPQTAGSIAANTRLLSASQVVRRVFRMAVLFVAARLLGVEVFGSYVLLLTIVEMICTISGYAYVDFLTREIARQPGAGWPLGVKVTLLRLAYIAPSVGTALLLLKLIHFPSAYLANTALLAVTLVPRAIGESAQGVMKGLQRFTPLPWIEFVQGGLVLAIAPILILKGVGLRGMISAEILAATGGALISLGIVIRWLNLKSVAGGSFRAVIWSTFAFNVYPFITSVYDRVDVILLYKLAGNFATGIYSLPYRAFATLQIIPYSLMGALLPAFSATQVGTDARENCSRAMKFLYAVALLIVLATMTYAGPIILLFLGQSYGASVVTIKILVWACVPAFLNFALNTILLAAHREKAFLWTAGVCMVFNITANLLLIPRFSYIAAAWITVLTELLLLAQNFYLVRRFMGHAIFPKDGMKITAGFIAVLSGFLVLRFRVPEFWAGSFACGMFALLAAWTGADSFKLHEKAAHQPSK
jgi:O-antigen/teichoic acid export membrane protein